MVLKLNNTLIGKKEEFKPLNKKRSVLYYTCGPTVHDYAHIGNFRTFVVQDVLKRWLEEKGYSVRHVMNITDVDEKTIERAERKKMELSKLTRRYEKAFFEDLDCLNIARADHYPRVSDNIDKIAEIVASLHHKGHAFKDQHGSYYYDINSFEGYGKLSGKSHKRRIRALMDREDYSAPKNFLLWRRCEAGNKNCWDSEIGRGIPGWHIECATLAQQYLGETIDIHSGGVDLIFPHHENEIAEAEGYTGKTFTRYWIHIEHLIVYGSKMSKSAGNFFTLRQIIKKGFDPRAMRLLYLKHHYRNSLDFDFEKLKRAQREIEYCEDVKKRLPEAKTYGKDDLKEELEIFKDKFTSYMDDDLHTDKAWPLMIGLIRDVEKRLEQNILSKKGIKAVRDTLSWADNIFAIGGRDHRHC